MASLYPIDIRLKNAYTLVFNFSFHLLMLPKEDVYRISQWQYEHFLKNSHFNWL